MKDIATGVEYFPAGAAAAAEREALRDQFALHAPPVPDWFEAAMPPVPEPPLRPSFGSPELLSVLQQIADRGWYFSVQLSPEERDIAESYGSRRKGHEAAVNQWKRRRAIERLTQWPWHYADLVLAERDVVMARREQR